MLRLPFKIVLFIGLIVFGTLFGLNKANVIHPGTITARTPDVAPCRRIAAPDNPVYVEVRWIWSRHYGWGCFWETEDGVTHTFSPMPK
jgi:hypothetical protein